MNYRHGFHAGNFADVLKHVVQLAIIDHLAKKDAAFCVLDSHAGRGSYDLTTGQAARTGEFVQGVGALWDAARTGTPPPLTARWLKQVRAFNHERSGGDALVAYPGSPRIARMAMRPQDRLIACELHPEENALLKAEFRNDPQVQVHLRDGWEALGALLPPKEKRGLVLIDPPYEGQEEELKQAADALLAAHARFPGGTVALWYPIKERTTIGHMHRRLQASGVRGLLAAELCVWPDDARLHLNGSGMMLVNPPWQLDAKLATELPWLWRHLNNDGGGRHTLRWLSPPA
ncbi:MAG: 23S rRNA (adenine(2030)-N(6))-methyltransferase RlmJ [Pseudomonadota bacterium]